MKKLLLPLCAAVFTLVLSVGAPSANAAKQNHIGEEKAKAIALQDAGLSASEVSRIFCKLDYDDGIAEYEVEFWKDSTEYEYDIDASTGKILGYDVDTDNDRW